VGAAALLLIVTARMVWAVERQLESVRKVGPKDRITVETFQASSSRFPEEMTGKSSNVGGS
jgi:hypothetical protein